MKTATLIAAAALIATACGAPSAERTARSPDPAEGAPAENLNERCAEPEIRYEVRYPEGWETNPGDVLPTCRVFDPGEIRLEEGTEIPFGYAISTFAEDRPYEEIVEAIGEGPGLEVRSTEETTVDGRTALQVEAVGTGEALLPDGMARYGYLVDLDERTLLATTYDAGDLDLETKRNVLDAMMDGLEWTGPDGASSHEAGPHPSSRLTVST